MKRVDDFRLKLGNKEYVPIMIGGMGVDISTSELALEAARLGGIGHISDAMVQDVSDRKFDTTFVKDKTKLYKFNINNMNKAVVQFDLDRLAEATRLHVGSTMEAKKGDGLIIDGRMYRITKDATAASNTAANVEIDMPLHIQITGAMSAYIVTKYHSLAFQYEERKILKGCISPCLA